MTRENASPKKNRSSKTILTSPSRQNTRALKSFSPKKYLPRVSGNFSWISAIPVTKPIFNCPHRCHRPQRSRSLRILHLQRRKAAAMQHGSSLAAILPNCLRPSLLSSRTSTPYFRSRHPYRPSMNRRRPPKHHLQHRRHLLSLKHESQVRRKTPCHSRREGALPGSGRSRQRQDDTCPHEGRASY